MWSWRRGDGWTSRRTAGLRQIAEFWEDFRFGSSVGYGQGKRERPFEICELELREDDAKQVEECRPAAGFGRGWRAGADADGRADTGGLGGGAGEGGARPQPDRGSGAAFNNAADAASDHDQRHGGGGCDRSRERPDYRPQRLHACPTAVD